jgi:Ala-tRNA(Pro) deacylase
LEHPLTHKIRTYLIENKITFKEVDHESAETCEKSAAARGEDLKIGGKTLLFKSKKGFSIFTLSAAKKLDSTKVRKILKSSKLRFARDEEFTELTGTVKGALPPLGRPILELDLYVDNSIFLNDKIAFNAGILTKSFILDIEDYKKIITYTAESFSS